MDKCSSFVQCGFAFMNSGDVLEDSQTLNHPLWLWIQAPKKKIKVCLCVLLKIGVTVAG